MSCPTTCILGENLTFTVQAQTSTGAPADAAGSVAYSVYEDETSTAILTGTMAKLASQTGFYSEQIGCTAANGFEQFKSYAVRITATVSAISVAKTYSFLCVGAGDTPSATTGALTTTALVKNYLGITSTDDDTLIGYLVSRATDDIENYCDRVLRSDTYRERYDGDGTTELLVNQYPVTAITFLSTQIQDVIRIKNTSSDAYNAYVTVTSNDADPSISETMTLTVQGGANAGSDDLTLASYTVTELTAAIVALAGGWTATIQSSELGVWESVEILPVSGLQCLDNWTYFSTPYEGGYEYIIRGQTMSPFNDNYGDIIVPIGLGMGTQNVTIVYTAGYTTTPAALEQICIDLVAIFYRAAKRDLTIKSEKLGDHSITRSENSRALPDDIVKRLAPYKRWSI